MDVRSLHEGNRDAWNRTAKTVYESSVDSDIQFLRGGGVALMDAEIPLLAKPGGRVIHLQCSHGLDALSLLNLGFDEAVGIDISEEMLAQAQRKSDELKGNATWMRSDVLQTPAVLDETADLVYTGKGAICWVMNLDTWAATVARLLKPGGRLFLFEGHPLDFAWQEDASEFVLREDGGYFMPAPSPERGFPYHAALRSDPSAPVNLTSRVWTIGEVVTAVIGAGLKVIHLEEFPEPFWDQFKQILPDTLRRLPHTFALIATK